MKELFVCLTFLALSSCVEHKPASEQELKDYVLDPTNGLMKRVSVNGVDIEVIYRPTDLILAQQLQGLKAENERRKEIESFSHLSYFVLKLSRQGQELESAYACDPVKFANVVNYLSSGVSANMYIMNGRDSIRCVDAVYARMFGAANATSVMAVFEADVRKLSGKLTFCFDDTELGLGRNEFPFEVAKINDVPTLNLN